MFAFLPLVALLSAFGLSTEYTTPTPRIDSTRGLPDYESQRAIYLEDSLADVAELDSPDSAACSTAIDTVDDPGSDVSVLPTPALVQVATRGNVAEPARAATCYIGLDCPE
jgi:hypothetical protein